MARNTYGGTVYDVAVNASNPAQLALSADGALPLYNASGVAQTDFKLWNTSTSAFDITATSVSVTGGYLPLFQGPDATELYTDAGAAHRLPHFDNLVSGGGTGTVTSVNTVAPVSGDVTLTQDNIPSGTTAKQFTATEKTFVDSAPDVTTSFTANVATALADPAATTAIQAIIANYLSVNSDYPSLYVGPSDPLPSSAPQGASLDVLSGSVTGSLSVSSLMAEAIAGGTSVTTAGTPTALGAGAVVTAAVTTYLSTGTTSAPAPTPATFAGLGLTWTQVSLSTTKTFNGLNSIAIYKGTGTGTTTKPTITFGSAPTTVHLRLSSIANAVGTVQQASSTAYATSNATPTINLPTPVGTGTATICWIVQNNASNVQTPGTGYTETAAALSSTGMRTSAAYALPSRQSASWTTPVTTGYQKLMAIVEVL